MSFTQKLHLSTRINVTKEKVVLFYEIAENELHEHTSLKYLGLVAYGKEDKDSLQAKAMAGSFETILSGKAVE